MEAFEGFRKHGGGAKGVHIASLIKSIQEGGTQFSKGFFRFCTWA